MHAHAHTHTLSLAVSALSLNPSFKLKVFIAEVCSKCLYTFAAHTTIGLSHSFSLYLALSLDPLFLSLSKFKCMIDMGNIHSMHIAKAQRRTEGK